MAQYGKDVKKFTKPDPLEDPNTSTGEGSVLDVLPYDGKVTKSYVPEGFDSVEEFLDDMREQYQADVDYDRLNRDAALDDKRFAAGEQWDPVVLEERKGLPCLVINNIPQFTAQLVGDWRQSRKAVKVVPDNDENEDVAQIRGDLIRNIEMVSRADRVYDNAFESLVQCGDGAFRISVEYARDSVFDQDLFIRPIEDAQAVVWDRYSVDPTGRDANRVFVNDRMPKKEFCKKWPDADPSVLFTDDLMDRVAQTNWCDDESYQVTEYWRLIQRECMLSLFANGKVFEMTDENFEDIVYKNGQPVKTRKSWCTYAQMHLVTGFAILTGPYEYRLSRVPIIRMSGRVVNVGGRRVRYGLVRFMKDPVRLKNFWRSIVAEQYGYAPKAQWIAPESAVEGREETFRKAHLSRDPLIVYNDGAETPPQRIDPPVPQAALSQEAQVNAQDMKDVTGIQDASLGIASNEVSGRAINARQQEGDIASLTFYDNGDAAVLEGGDVLNQLIPQVMDGTRVARLVGEDETVKFIALNDPMNPEAIDLSVGQYEVALSTGTSYTTRRVEAAQAMMDAIQVYPQLMQVAPDLIVKAQDWPGADKLSARLKKTVPPQLLDDDDPDKQEMMAQGQLPNPEQIQEGLKALQEAQAKIQILEQELRDKSTELMISEYNAQTQRIRALSDNEVDGNKIELDGIKTILNGSIKLDEHDMQRNEHMANFSQKEHHKVADLAMDHAQFLHGEANKVGMQTQAHQNSLELAKTPPPVTPGPAGGGTTAQSSTANG